MAGARKFLASSVTADRLGLRAAGSSIMLIQPTPPIKITGKRDAFTLIEMLIAVSVMMTMMGIAFGLLSALLRAERSGIAHVVRLTTVSRLARQFRSDIHAATDLQLPTADPTKPLLQITAGDQRQIQYEIQPQGLLRTETGSARPIPSRDLMRLKGTRFHVEESATSPRIVTLIIETPEASPADPRRPSGNSREVRVEAVVGRDFRDQ